MKVCVWSAAILFLLVLGFYVGRLMLCHREDAGKKPITKEEMIRLMKKAGLDKKFIIEEGH